MTDYRAEFIKLHGAELVEAAALAMRRTRGKLSMTDPGVDVNAVHAIAKRLFDLGYSTSGTLWDTATKFLESHRPAVDALAWGNDYALE